ncbi:hypothetical protein [Massilia sp. IC2-476]|uniref:hypothetical protein n=1 Tax=Massilia sp. IC2-476 TaxID=2887199 RepID=UPI001D110757|nr:hypothetical protein [Massilia sp. IC2-476]MCC2971069.1 hypothetical protein [Massilia sp. IC2-476]
MASLMNGNFHKWRETMQADRNRTNRQIEPKVGAVNYVLIALLVILPTVFGFLEKPTEMGVIIVACSLALCFANLNKIQSFKGAGFEAQMREAVQEAYATLDRLQEMVRPVARATIANVAYSGRWDSMDRETEHELMAELTNLVTALDLQDDSGIAKMRADFYSLHANDHLRFLIAVMERAHIKNDSVKQRLTSLLKGRLTDNVVPPSVESLRAIVAELPLEQRHILEPFILDYGHYVDTHTYRRPEAYSYDLLRAFPSSAPNQN